jgi:hypothetical protein
LTAAVAPGLDAERRIGTLTRHAPRRARQAEADSGHMAAPMQLEAQSIPDSLLACWKASNATVTTNLYARTGRKYQSRTVAQLDRPALSAGSRRGRGVHRSHHKSQGERHHDAASNRH